MNKTQKSSVKAKSRTKKVTLNWEESKRIIPIRTDGNIPYTYQELIEQDYYTQHKYVGRSFSTFMSVCTSPESVYIGLYTTYLRHSGRKVFPKSEIKACINYRAGKYCKVQGWEQGYLDVINTLITIFNELNLEWFAYEISKVANTSIFNDLFNASILKSVFLGNITNRELLYKALIKRVYRTPSVSWKLVYEYISTLNSHYGSYGNMRRTCYVGEHFTTDANKFIKRIMTAHDYSHTFNDLINLCIKSGERLNPEWSKLRIKEEHDRISRELTWKEKDITNPNMSILPTRIEFDKWPEVMHINTPQEIFDTANQFHNCVFSCYCEYIIKQKYFVFIMRSRLTDENICIGIRKYDDHLTLDQVYYKCNRYTSDEDFTLVNEFVNDFITEFTPILCANTKFTSILCANTKSDTEAVESFSFDWSSFLTTKK